MYETGLLLAHVALLLLPLSLFLGVRAPSLSLAVASGSKLLDVAHCSLFILIVASTLPLVFRLRWR